MSTQPSLFAWGCQRYPAIPGHRQRPTSRAAAIAAKPRQRQLQARVLAALREREMTADETASAIGEDRLSIRPRCSELALPTKKRLALIEDSGERRRNTSGKPAIVWRLIA